MEKIKDYSFGIIPILKCEGGEFKFLILENVNSKAWGFPKGHKEGEEDELEAARRELFEESGINEIKLIDGLRYSEKYNTVRKGIPLDKTVIFYAALVNEDNVIMQEEEISNFKWATYEESLNTFIHDNPKRILSELMSDLKKLSI